MYANNRQSAPVRKGKSSDSNDFEDYLQKFNNKSIRITRLKKTEKEQPSVEFVDISKIITNDSDSNLFVKPKPKPKPNIVKKPSSKPIKRIRKVTTYKKDSPEANEKDDFDLGINKYLKDLKVPPISKQKKAPNFNCRICDLALTNASERTEHEVKVHRDEYNTYNCTQCKFRNRFAAAVKAHSVYHTGSDFHCEICNTFFLDEKILQRHNKNNHQLSGEDFLCHICSRRYKKRSILLTHVLRHKKNKLFTCNDCGKTYKDGSDLRRHRYTHGGVPTIQCPFCDKKFFEKKLLRYHMKRHPGKVLDESLATGYSNRIKVSPTIQKKTESDQVTPNGISEKVSNVSKIEKEKNVFVKNGSDYPLDIVDMDDDIEESLAPMLKQIQLVEDLIKKRANGIENNSITSSDVNELKKIYRELSQVIINLRNMLDDRSTWDAQELRKHIARLLPIENEKQLYEFNARLEDSFYATEFKKIIKLCKPQTEKYSSTGLSKIFKFTFLKSLSVDKQNGKGSLKKFKLFINALHESWWNKTLPYDEFEDHLRNQLKWAKGVAKKKSK